MHPCIFQFLFCTVHVFNNLFSKLRLKYYPDRPPVGEFLQKKFKYLKNFFHLNLHYIVHISLDGPFYPPEADFANNWNGFAEVNHM